MKHTYETIIIFTDKLSEEKYNITVDKYRKFMNLLPRGGARHRKAPDKLGLKKLAYPIRGSDSGWYVVFTYVTDQDNIAEVERELRIDDNVIKFLTIKTADDEDEEDIKDYVRDDLNPDLIKNNPETPQKSEQDFWDDVFDINIKESDWYAIDFRL